MGEVAEGSGSALTEAPAQAPATPASVEAAPEPDEVAKKRKITDGDDE